MSWVAAIGAGGAVAGGLLGSGVLGGKKEDPQIRMLKFYFRQLYGPHGVNTALGRDLGAYRKTWTKDILPLYKANLAGAETYGREGRARINDWVQSQGADADQGLISSGLTNSTVRLNAQAGIGAKGQRERNALEENVAGYTAGQRLNLADAYKQFFGGRQAIKDTIYGNQLGAFGRTGFSGSASTQFNLAQQQAQGNAWGSLADAFGGIDWDSIFKGKPAGMTNGTTPQDSTGWGDGEEVFN